MSKSSRNKRGDRYAQVIVPVIESDAWRWLPHFARTVLYALAGEFTGFNNGALELPPEVAARRGISKPELYAGIGLLLRAGLIKRTVSSRRHSGKGIPARYALTWKPLSELPKFNVTATVVASNEWQKFAPPFTRVKSVREAQVRLGHRRDFSPIPQWRVPQPLRGYRPDSEEADVTRQLNRVVPGCHPPSEQVVTRHAKTDSEDGARHTIKNAVKQSRRAVSR